MTMGLGNPGGPGALALHLGGHCGVRDPSVRSAVTDLFVPVVIVAAFAIWCQSHGPWLLRTLGKKVELKYICLS